MINYYILLRLNRKEYEIMNIKEENGIIWVELKSRKFNKFRNIKDIIKLFYYS